MSGAIAQQDQWPSLQSTEKKPAKKSLKKCTSKKIILSHPRVKWQSFPEIIMMLDASVIEKYPELIKKVKAFHADSMIKENANSHAPQLTTAHDLGHGAVCLETTSLVHGTTECEHKRGLWIHLQNTLRTVPSDSFSVMSMNWLRICGILYRIEQAIRRLHDARYLTFLVVTGIKQAIDGQRKKIDKQFKSAMWKGRRDSGRI